MGLLPCPFCGGTGVPRDAAGGRQNWIECTTKLCGAMGPNLATAREAAIGWNRRTPEPEVLRRAGVEQLWERAHAHWQAGPKKLLHAFLGKLLGRPGRGR